MKDLKIYIGIFSFVIAVYLVALYKQPKKVNWKETYSRNDKIPYGTYILHNRLTDIFPGSAIKNERKPLSNVFKDEQIKNGSYIVIASTVGFDEYDFKRLATYMNKGNNVFIAAYSLSPYLNDTLKLGIGSDFAAHPTLKFNAKGINNKKYTFEQGIGDQFFSKFDTSKVVVLGVNQANKANFIKYNYGKGGLYLIPTPQIFSNFNLLNPSGADYAAKALSHMKVGGDIIWDDYPSMGSEEESSIMRVFFQHKELKFAYYIALFSLILFVLFEMKRRQRIIPVITSLSNSTLEFVELIGRVYYQERDHLNIAKKKINYLLEYIRATYNIRTNSIDKEFKELLVAKSGMPLPLIDDLLSNVNYCLSVSKITDNQLMELNKVMEEFYNKSK